MIHIELIEKSLGEVWLTKYYSLYIYHIIKNYNVILIITLKYVILSCW